jgi:hypothetical protein
MMSTIKAAQLKPGQFFASEYDNANTRYLCVAHTDTHALYVRPPFDEVLLYHHNNAAIPLSVSDWDDEPQRTTPQCDLCETDYVAKDGDTCGTCQAEIDGWHVYCNPKPDFLIQAGDEWSLRDCKFSPFYAPQVGQPVSMLFGNGPWHNLKVRRRVAELPAELTDKQCEAIFDYVMSQPEASEPAPFREGDWVVWCDGDYNCELIGVVPCMKKTGIIIIVSATPAPMRCRFAKETGWSQLVQLNAKFNEPTTRTPADAPPAPVDAWRVSPSRTSGDYEEHFSIDDAKQHIRDLLDDWEWSDDITITIENVEVAEQLTEIRFFDGDTATHFAKEWRWKHESNAGDIVAYRPVTPAPSPQPEPKKLKFKSISGFGVANTPNTQCDFMLVACCVKSTKTQETMIAFGLAANCENELKRSCVLWRWYYRPSMIETYEVRKCQK